MKIGIALALVGSLALAAACVQSKYGAMVRPLAATLPEDYVEDDTPKLPGCGASKACVLTVHVDWVRKQDGTWNCGVVAVLPQLLNVYDRSRVIEVTWEIESKIPGDFIFSQSDDIAFVYDPNDPDKDKHFGVLQPASGAKSGTVRALRTRAKKLFSYNAKVSRRSGEPCEALDPVIVNRD